MSRNEPVLVTSINSEPLTPLLDVLFTVLIALAMFVKPATPEVSLAGAPTSARGNSDSRPTLNLVLKSDGSLTLDDQTTVRSGLVTKLKATAAQQKAAIKLRADRQCLHADVTDLINELVDAQLDVIEVRTAAERGPAEKPR